MLKKYFSEEEDKVAVKFSLLVNRAKDAEEILLVGEFNDWLREGEKRIPMHREDDAFTVQLTLDMNQEYQYLYVVYSNNQINWLIDWHADKYVPSPLRGSNSVVITHKFMK